MKYSTASDGKFEPSASSVICATPAVTCDGVRVLITGVGVDGFVPVVVVVVVVAELDGSDAFTAPPHAASNVIKQSIELRLPSLLTTITLPLSKQIRVLAG